MRCLASLVLYGLLEAEPAAAAQHSGGTLIQEAVERYFDSLQRLREMSYKRRTDKKEFDAAGNLRSRARTTTLTEFVDGVRWSYVAEKDDRPVDGHERLQARVRMEVAEWKSKTPEQRRRILEDARKRGRRESEYLREFAEALDFTLLGSEMRAGRATAVFSFKPRPGYRPKALEGRVYEGVNGKVWIDEAEQQMARLEATVVKDVSVGGFLAKVEKGTRFELDQTRLKAGLWAPRRQLLRFDVRVLMFKRIHNLVESDYYDYKKHTGPVYSGE